MRRNIAIVTLDSSPRRLNIMEDDDHLFPDDFFDIDFANIGMPDDVDMEQLLDSLEQGMLLPRFQFV